MQVWNMLSSSWAHLFYLLFVVCVLATMLIFYFISRGKDLPDSIDNKVPSALLGKWIRAYWFWVSSPVERLFIRLKISPNALSIVAGILSIATALLFAYGYIGAGGCLLIVSGSLDFFDGRVARATNRTASIKGKYIDGVMDRFCDAVILIGISWHYRDTVFLLPALLLMFASLMIPFNRTQGEALGIRYLGGMTQRAERVVYLGFGAVLSSIMALFIFPWASMKYQIDTLEELTSYIYVIPLLFVSVLACLTALGIFLKIYGMIKEKES